MPTFEQVAGQAFDMTRTVAALTAPCTLEALPSRVRTWHSFTETYEAHAETVAKTRAVADALDAERIESGRAHVCRLLGGRCGHLVTVESKHALGGGAWTTAWSQTLGEGRPVEVAR